METILIGSYIRQKRQDKGWSQEFLCEGICDRSSLSRIEHNKQAPSPGILKRLLNKLDLPEGQIFALKSLDDIASAKLYKCIQDETVLFRRKPKDQPQIRKRILKNLEELENLCGENDLFFRQFALSTLAALNGPDGNYSHEERLRILLEAIRLTIPRFNEMKIPDFYYSSEEIILVNQIARTYSRMGNRKKAISISSRLLKYIEKNNKDLDKYARQFCLAAHNHAIDLGLEKQYKKAIQVSEKGRNICAEKGDYEFLPGFLAIMAECYFFLGDLDTSKHYYIRAYYIYDAIGDASNRDNTQRDIKEHLGLEIS